MARNKRDRFLALAEARTQRVLDNLRLIGNLGNSRNYEYNEAEVRQIFRAIEKEVEVAKSRFASGSGRSANPFRLKD